MELETGAIEKIRKKSGEEIERDDSLHRTVRESCNSNEDTDK